MEIDKKIRLLYICEDATVRSIASRELEVDFELLIHDHILPDKEELWALVREKGIQAIVIVYHLNESDKLSYTCYVEDEVEIEIRKHNKHLPFIILKSFDEDFILEHGESLTFYGFGNSSNRNLWIMLRNIIKANVEKYNEKKAFAQKIIKNSNDKAARGESLTGVESSDKFDAELYLSELDLDSGEYHNLITQGTTDSFKELLELGRSIVAKYRDSDKEALS